MNQPKMSELEALEVEIASLLSEAGLGDAELFVKQVRQERENLDIFVMGQVKDGKSTFLNSLLVPTEGYELPMGVDPLTMKPWRLIYNSESSPMVRAVSKDNKLVGEWPWSQIKAIQNEERFWSDIKEFQTSLSSTLLGNLEKTIFWDTPGFNDTSVRDDGVPRIEESELVSAISNSEVVVLVCRRTTYKNLDNVLKELSKSPIRKYIAVLNLKTTEEWDKREDYKREIEEYLKGLFGRDTQVFSVNCKEAFLVQQKLIAFAHDFQAAVESFQGNSDIQQLIDRSWAEDLDGHVKNIKDSGIAPLRAELRKMLENRASLVWERAIWRLFAPIEDATVQFDARKKECGTRLGELQTKLTKMNAALSDRNPGTDIQVDIKRHVCSYAAAQKGKWLEDKIRQALEEAWKCSYPKRSQFTFGWMKAYDRQKEKLRNRLSETLRVKIIPQLDSEVTDFLVPFMSDRLHTLMVALLNNHTSLTEKAGVIFDGKMKYDYGVSLSITPEALPPLEEEPFSAISGILSDEIKDAAIVARRDGSRLECADEYLAERITNCLVEWWQQRAVKAYAVSMKKAVDESFSRECGKLEDEAKKSCQPLLEAEKGIAEEKEELVRLESLLKKVKDVHGRLDALTTKETYS